MTRILTRSIFPFGFLAGAIIAISWFVINSAAFTGQPGLMSMASTIDLALLIPVTWFLCIRKTKIPKVTVIPMFLLSLLLASQLIPVQYHQTLDYLKMILPIVELTVIGFIIYQVRKTFKAYRSEKSREKRQDFVETVLEAANNIHGPGILANVLATEVSMFHYAVVGWNPQKEAPKGPKFTYHKDNAYLAFAGVAVFAVIAETAILHLLLMQWSAVAAWILTGLSIYSLFFVFGDLNAVKKRPIYLDENALKVRIGFRWRVSIPFEAIESVELRTPNKEQEEFANFILVGEANLVIKLREKVTALGLYGLKKEFTKLALHIDDKQGFIAALKEKMEG